MSGLRVALIDHARTPASATLAARLGDAGHQATLVCSAGWAPFDAALRRRGFTGPLSPVLPSIRALRAQTYDVVHAFSATDGVAARLWRRSTGGPIVFTCVEVLDRAHLSDRRLRLALLRRAIEGSDVVVAASEPARNGVLRWMGVEVAVIDVGDAAAYAGIYREALWRPS